jgi:predicted deacylase
LWPESAVGALEDGCRRVMQHLGMRDEAPPPATAPRVIDAFEWSRSPAAGCWYPAVKAGQKVSAGDPLGVVTDLLGAPLHEARSTVDGTVLFAVTSLAINDGDPLVGIGTTVRSVDDGRSRA